MTATGNLQQPIRNMLAFHGFVDAQTQAKDELNAAAVGLVGTGNYASVDDMLFDLTQGGTFRAPADTPKAVIDLVFMAAYGNVPSIDYTDLGDGTYDWGEA